MNKLVVKPLRTHLQKLFLDYYTKTGAIRLLADSIHYASYRQDKILKPQVISFQIYQLCNNEIYVVFKISNIIHFQHRIFVPSDGILGRISQYLQRLQNAHSPLEKLEYLLAAIAVLFNSVSINSLQIVLNDVTSLFQKKKPSIQHFRHFFCKFH